MNESLQTPARAASQLGKVIAVALRESPLEPAGYRLLAYLSLGETASSVLARKLEVSRPTVTATVDWLEARGLVERLPDPLDKRKVKIKMTRIGAAALREADELAVAKLEEVLTFLDQEKVQAVIESLRDLHDALTAYRARDYLTDTAIAPAVASVRS